MDDHVTYHSLHCRGLSVDQATGELRYDSSVMWNPVAQFIGPKPLSENCDSFSIEIVNSGMRSFISVGLCHKRYPEGRQPGWDDNSIGYHADDGGIYHETGWPNQTYGIVGQGEVMECSFNFDDRRVTFLRNGTQVFTSEQLSIPAGGFYPIVGLHSPGEIARLLELDPWTPDYDVLSQSKDVVFHSLYCREARVSQTSGIVRYQTESKDVPVGQFVSECPLSPECNKFSVEIASLGQRSGISIGVCHRCYPSNCQPGWLPNSIAYHVDDGGIFNGGEQPCAKGPRARAGDTVSCEFDFSTGTFDFRRNGRMVYRSPAVTIPPGGFHAAVGFHSPGEAVCLIEREPWRSATGQPSTAPQKYHFTSLGNAKCVQAYGTVSYNGGTCDSVAQVISKCPLTPTHNSFSVEILNPGKKCRIEIGLCPHNYPVNNQLGVAMDSVGYHAHTGRLCVANDRSYAKLAPVPATKGDIITCKFNFADSSVSFSVKGRLVFKTNQLTVPPGGFFAAVGLNSEFESVRLCETDPWRKDDIQPSPKPEMTMVTPTTPKCCICMEKGVSRFLIPCGHTFCVDCIEEWTVHHKTCPACRMQYQDVKMLFF